MEERMTVDKNAEQASYSQVPLPVPQTGLLLPTGQHRDREFICGWGAAFINICITFPINKTIFRQQLHGVSITQALQQLRSDGVQYLYRGLLPPLLQKTSSLSIMFGGYYMSQDFLQVRLPSLSVYVNHTIAAMTAGTLEAVLNPFERVQTLMQTAKYHNRFSNTLDAFKHLRQYGLKEYYRGLSVIILRNGPSNVAFFLGREWLQKHVPKSNTGTEKMLKDFICGAMLGMLISSVFYPLNVIKTQMQCKLGGPFDGIWVTFKRLWQERNGSVRGIFKGVHLNYMRSFLSWGIINASFEFLMETLYNERHQRPGIR
ncbi:solute carrier family 25 member 51 [Biomphalaria glabrata]|uniref:Mitochondrial nicotinamide adenine dinucleotide transporter SLC25A51-like n=1 Tax=Biomphalaria glabrata TaxID=6526 RepID=A0A9W2ZAN0_BIOGL|nr:mitochondrial nicotinamide adenine dinucleotide transporter SLC25A51-like [Biomphalaria glabrata]XP_013067282.2 mitochondrial nicotinamide adenine dinucleotide transporter SLC25A51-like [Biomphalaria glabrata]XP_055872020.1 mitochondrial nicotinamide adenine dinucleotide transporter SLC25A51-like [Biomphalaria glabrata]XP_055872022.1 mitochondrial nicotinamide adenine dinucleotide transporter SLC25A51-like [Biomphalaria glabrata]KAI8737062.1 solute carrier family 25 member 51-like [Biomphala